MKVRHLDFERYTIFNPFAKTQTAKRLIPITQNIDELLKLRVARNDSPWVFYSPGGAGRKAHFEKHIGSVRKAQDAAVAYKARAQRWLTPVRSWLQGRSRSRKLL
jgi:integrase